MKKISLVIITFILSGCGGGASSSLGGTSFNNIDSQMLEICNATNSNTLDLVSGDSIKKLVTPTVVRVITDPDGSQRACTVSGRAIVLH